MGRLTHIPLCVMHAVTHRQCIKYTMHAQTSAQNICSSPLSRATRFLLVTHTHISVCAKQAGVFLHTNTHSHARKQSRTCANVRDALIAVRHVCIAHRHVCAMCVCACDPKHMYAYAQSCDNRAESEKNTHARTHVSISSAAMCLSVRHAARSLTRRIVITYNKPANANYQNTSPPHRHCYVIIFCEMRTDKIL